MFHLHQFIHYNQIPPKKTSPFQLTSYHDYRHSIAIAGNTMHAHHADGDFWASSPDFRQAECWYKLWLLKTSLNGTPIYTVTRVHNSTMCSMHRRAMQSVVSVYVYIYVTKYWQFSILPVKKMFKKYSCCFLSHLDVVNVTVNCLFTPGWALLSSCLCAPSGLPDPGVRH